MKAIVITEPGPPEVLQLADRPDPVPGPGSILVRVAATSVNRADLLQRQGHYPAPRGAPEDIPGLEYAGTVEAVGEGVTRWKAGDRVMGLVAGGGYAERVVVPADHALPVPDALSLEEAAAVPEVEIPTPPFWGVKVLDIPVDEVVECIDLNTLYRMQWGAKNLKGEELRHN